MSTDATSESAAQREDKRLNNLVAVTVVILTVFLAVSKVKDDNIVQAMQKAQSDAVDAWAEYQSARIKLHVDENGLTTLRLLENLGNIDRDLAVKQAAQYQAEITKYEARSVETMGKAKTLEAEYNRLNVHDDQFDMSEAFISIAIALSAVGALVDSFPLLYIAWGSGALGIIFGVAGFLNFSLHWDWLAKFLGT